MTNYAEQKTVLQRIAGYLEKLSIPYKMVDYDETKYEKFPVIVTQYKYKDLGFDLVIADLDNWISGKCYFLNLEKFPDDTKYAFYDAALEFNYKLPETTFSKHGDQLIVEFDMLENGSFEDFKWNLLSISQGIDTFVNTLEDVMKELNNSKGKFQF